ncbi:hypothetical protein [Rhodomicrobium vannielii]|nr:hypothetical protein [Rhodomicrobium vannielii]
MQQVARDFAFTRISIAWLGLGSLWCLEPYVAADTVPHMQTQQ